MIQRRQLTFQRVVVSVHRVLRPVTLLQHFDGILDVFQSLQAPRTKTAQIHYSQAAVVVVVVVVVFPS